MGIELGNEDVSKQKPHVGRAFGEAANKPRIPVRAIGDEDDGAATFLGETFLFGALNAVEHLDFELRFSNSLPCQELADAADERDVVRPEGSTSAISSQFRVKHFLCEREIVFINIKLFRISDGGGFFVSALY